MKLVILGLDLKGGASLLAQLATPGREVVCLSPAAEAPPIPEIPRCRIIRFPSWQAARPLAKGHCDEADVAMVVACAHAPLMSDLALGSRARIRLYWETDTARLMLGLGRAEAPLSLPTKGLAGFDAVLASAVGPALEDLQEMLGARRVAPFFPWAEPLVGPASAKAELGAALACFDSALEADEALDNLFIQPARHLAHCHFLFGGRMPGWIAPPSNVAYAEPTSPEHRIALLQSARLSLHVHGAELSRIGAVPTARLFAAAAAGCAIVTDLGAGLDRCFAAGEEALVAEHRQDVIEALQLDDEELRLMGQRARERCLAEHTASARARRLEEIWSEALSPLGTGIR
jgi:hypothetical protein